MNDGTLWMIVGMYLAHGGPITILKPQFDAVGVGLFGLADLCFLAAFISWLRDRRRRRRIG